MHNRTVKQYLLFLASFLLLTFSRVGAQPTLEIDNHDNGQELRIVSLSPNVTETLYALGAGETLVGRSDYCNYPEQVTALPSVGTLYNPSLETLLSLEPTVAISSAFVPEDFLSSVERAGIEVVQLDTQQTFQGTYGLIRKIAEVVGKQSEAELMILSMQNTVREVVSSYKNETKPSVYMVIDFGGFDA
ncbi:MAG: cobalamin transport system substrate-binding protein, partial [Sphaerochaeta sp.]|nr:cobalamin transport system substrate-binding protein [Sphaerochaeta sp.]